MKTYNFKVDVKVRTWVKADFPDWAYSTIKDMLRYDNGEVKEKVTAPFDNGEIVIFTISSKRYTEKRWWSFGLKPYDLTEVKVK